MNMKELFRGNRGEKPSKSNILKYPVGTRVPQNEKADRIVRNALYQNSTLSSKRSV